MSKNANWIRRYYKRTKRVVFIQRKDSIMIPQLPIDSHYQLARELTKPRREKAVQQRSASHRLLSLIQKAVHVIADRSQLPKVASDPKPLPNLEPTHR